jgi:hypothetical protein
MSLTTGRIYTPTKRTPVFAKDAGPENGKGFDSTVWSEGIITNHAFRT